ncbi:hypothetical protein [Kocuria marina]|uniref:hypothetical protein n=1 Tax=Kocuria marina TaxID=223184 RepID=UPI002989E4F1|nr:hypothetical protein [Kocuria marina]MCT2021646.1 hypothetical protein [Kocuria marina]
MNIQQPTTPKSSAQALLIAGCVAIALGICLMTTTPLIGAAVLVGAIGLLLTSTTRRVTMDCSRKPRR